MTDPAQMPRYKCHKEVYALKIVGMRTADNPNDEAYVEITPEAPYAPFTVSRQWFIKHGPVQGGYYVVYEGGYASFSPAKAFEDGYTLIE